MLSQPPLPHAVDGGASSQSRTDTNWQLPSSLAHRLDQPPTGSSASFVLGGDMPRRNVLPPAPPNQIGLGQVHGGPPTEVEESLPHLDEHDMGATLSDGERTHAVEFLVQRYKPAPGDQLLSRSGKALAAPAAADVSRRPLDPFELPTNVLKKAAPRPSTVGDSIGPTPIPILSSSEFPWYGGCFRDAHEHPEVLHRVLRGVSIPDDMRPEFERLVEEAQKNMKLNPHRWRVIRAITKMRRKEGPPIPRPMSPTRKLSHSVYTPQRDQTIWTCPDDPEGPNRPLTKEMLHQLLANAWQNALPQMYVEQPPGENVIPRHWMFVPRTYTGPHPQEDMRALGVECPIYEMTDSTLR